MCVSECEGVREKGTLTRRKMYFEVYLEYHQRHLDVKKT
jgi:hypothetical protein